MKRPKYIYRIKNGMQKNIPFFCIILKIASATFDFCKVFYFEYN